MSETTKSPIFVEVKGNAIDLFAESTGNSIFMHGANCQRTMGAGIANEVRLRMPALFYIDQYDQRTAPERFGSYSATTLENTKESFKLGVNLYTQFMGGANFEISALRNSLDAFCYSIPMAKRRELKVYIPHIGTGIGGGNLDEVRKTLKDKLRDFQVYFVEFKLPSKVKGL